MPASGGGSASVGFRRSSSCARIRLFQHRTARDASRVGHHGSHAAETRGLASDENVAALQKNLSCKESRYVRNERALGLRCDESKVLGPEIDG